MNSCHIWSGMFHGRKCRCSCKVVYFLSAQQDSETKRETLAECRKCNLENLVVDLVETVVLIYSESKTLFSLSSLIFFFQNDYEQKH